ncbi:MAG: DUF1343 domain-containing protein [Paludibacteraceae bacterium]|nr:DUF1343 domain-containing protein [Paludibacteraceae bacterium]
MKKPIIILLLVIGAINGLSADNTVVVGAEQISAYLPLLQNKTVGIVANQTSMVKDIHLVDFLVSIGTNIHCIFAVEHGFRGKADAGAHITSYTDKTTGIPVRSLYDGGIGKPSDEIMSYIDIIIFDMQDVGLRYYTYLTTLTKMMEACADNNKLLLILDRPNPNGHYVDGPILDMKYKSGVGYLPIPIVHGMTFGEMALMINGEKWLPEGKQCNLRIITCSHYTHKTLYKLPIAPSPNLPNMRAVYLYPSLCYFEATPVSVGRGTNAPFQVYGHPNMLGYDFSFIPTSKTGAQNPLQMGLKCYGRDLRTVPDNEEIFERGVDLRYLIDAYKNLHIGNHFFSPFFEKLIGVDYVRTMIKEGKSAEEIRAVWQNDVQKFKQQRTPYLLYKE